MKNSQCYNYNNGYDNAMQFGAYVFFIFSSVLLSKQAYVNLID